MLHMDETSIGSWSSLLIMYRTAKANDRLAISSIDEEAADSDCDDGFSKISND